MRNRELPIGHKIRTIRVAQGLSQVDLSKKSGLGRPVLSNLERGRYLPTPAHIAILEAAFGLRLDAPQVEAALLLLAGRQNGDAGSESP